MFTLILQNYGQLIKKLFKINGIMKIVIMNQTHKKLEELKNKKLQNKKQNRK
jgi:hypothetical protein